MIKALQEQENWMKRFNCHQVLVHHALKMNFLMKMMDHQMAPPKRRGLSKKVLDSNLSATLDRTLTTNRDGVHLIKATAQCLEHSPNELVINRESFRRYLLCCNGRRYLKNPSSHLTVHWDGKIVLALNGVPAVDRLSVLVSGNGVEKLLTVHSLPNGTGEATAIAVVTTLEKLGG